MSKHDPGVMLNEGIPSELGPSEPQVHTEHQDALDATLFRRASDPFELVLELEAGQLRMLIPRED